MFRSLLFLTPLVFLICAACGPALMREVDVRNMNNRIQNQVYRAKADIQPVFSQAEDEEDAIYPRGALLKLRVESDGDWLRVRALPAEEDVENNPGKIIIYIFRDFLEENDESDDIVDAYPAERLEADIAEILEPVS